MNEKKLFTITALVGASGVACGAFGAHALADFLTEKGSMGTWETAVFYHLVHAVAALVVLFHLAERPALRLSWLAWTIGILLFSGSLYGLAVDGPRWLGPITPLGGLAFILGWLNLLRGRYGT